MWDLEGHRKDFSFPWSRIRSLRKALSREWHHLIFIFMTSIGFLYWKSMIWREQGQSRKTSREGSAITQARSDGGLDGDGGGVGGAVEVVRRGQTSVHLESWASRICWQIGCGVWEREVKGDSKVLAWGIGSTFNGGVNEELGRFGEENQDLTFDLVSLRQSYGGRWRQNSSTEAENRRNMSNTTER